LFFSNVADIDEILYGFQPHFFLLITVYLNMILWQN